MKTLYQCDVCNSIHTTEEKTLDCEKRHTIITPSWWWVIPFLGFILLIWSVMVTKNGIVIFPETKMGEIIKYSIPLGPALCSIAFILYAWAGTGVLGF